MLQGQVVDTPTATEFTRLALEQVSKEELGDIARLLEHKADAFGRLLSPDRIGSLSLEDAEALLRSVFATRRRTEVILGDVTLPGFIDHANHLLWGTGDPADRLAAFHDRFSAIGRGLPATIGHDLGSELLHFTDPERHWLWTRWMWDPDSEKGALALVTMDEVSLTGIDTADTYRRVGEAVAFVTHVGEAAGFRVTDNHRFGTDVFLASVYAVYMYTTLRIRMTQEFAKIMPQLPELLRRLLGVHKSALVEGAAA